MMQALERMDGRNQGNSPSERQEQARELLRKLPHSAGGDGIAPSSLKAEQKSGTTSKDRTGHMAYMCRRVACTQQHEMKRAARCSFNHSN